MKKVLLLLLFSYFLCLFQTSFLVHFQLFGLTPNILLLSVILFSLFKKKPGFENSGLLAAFFGGFFLDIFSSSWIGFNVLLFLAVFLFVRLILKRYVRSPAF